jgi:hypothetical protein
VVKKRKRAPGGGRKSNPNKKVMFSTRLEPHVLAALKAAAETWPGKNVSILTERLINDGLRKREEATRDPSLQALLFLIGQLAEHISGGIYEADKKLVMDKTATWRTDLFKFRAFKVAIGKLLGAIPEPPSTMTDEQRMQAITETAEQFDAGPELFKLMMDTYMSPEAFGAKTFVDIWTRVPSDRDLTGEYPRYYGRVMDSELAARQALMLPALKPRTTKPKDKADD